MNDTSESSLSIPQVSRLAGFLILGLILYGAARAVFITGELPLLLPLLASLLSVMFLLGVNVGKDPVTSLARLGFHVGLFAYFISIPLLFPENIEQGFSDSVHLTVGIMLIVTVLGFEGAYHLKGLLSRKTPRITFPAGLTRLQRRFLAAFLCVGLAAWLLKTLDYSTAAQVSLVDIVLSMRGRIEGALENPVTELGQWSYVLSSGLYLAVASAFLLLTSRGRPSLAVHLTCWPAIVLCSALGFLSGSRALFLYSFTPLVLAVWVQLTRLSLGRTFRVLVIVWAASMLLIVWVAMSAIRGQDVRRYEVNIEEMSPSEYARGAFDMYSSSALIVQTFPDEIDYEYGRSLIPVVLGWMPRSVWPNKPYPFAVHVNTIQGESLEDRSASIAVGLSGEGYGNFGLLGVLIWSALMGISCRFADGFLGKFHPSNSLRLFLGASISIWAAMIVRGGVPEMFYMGLQVNMFPLALSLLLRLIGKRSRSLVSPTPLYDPLRSPLRPNAIER